MSDDEDFGEDLSLEDIKQQMEQVQQEKVDNNEQLKIFALDYKAARAVKDECEAALKEANAKVEEAEFRLVDLMRKMGLSSAKMPEVGQVVLREENFVRQLPEREAEFYAYLDKEGEAAIIRSTINPQTLKGFVNNRLKAAAENGTLDQARRELEQYVSIFPKTRATLRKS